MKERRPSEGLQALEGLERSEGSGCYDGDPCEV